jgi:putative FmdB family regulatory protein
MICAMPIYEYACTSCGERTEAKQSFDDPPLETCAQCGGKLRKLYSPVGVVFRGSGFYSTDGRKQPEGGKKEAKPEASKSSTDKSESSAAGSSKDKPA